MSFEKIRPEDIDGNVFKMIGDDWMLVTAETEKGVNTMTASWGGMGVLWNKPVAFVFIRPQRYTFEFTENSDVMTLSFFGGEKREALKICGSLSGRDCPKIEKAGLTPYRLGYGLVPFEGAHLAVCAKKIYTDMIKPENMLCGDIMKNYPKCDFHKMYIAEICDVYKGI